MKLFPQQKIRAPDKGCQNWEHGSTSLGSSEGLSLPPEVPSPHTLSTSPGRRRGRTRTSRRRCLTKLRGDTAQCHRGGAGARGPREAEAGRRGRGQDEGARGDGWVCRGGGCGGGGVPAALTEGLEVLDRGHATLRREAGAAGKRVRSGHVSGSAVPRGGGEQQGAREG